MHCTCQTGLGHPVLVRYYPVMDTFFQIKCVFFSTTRGNERPVDLSTPRRKLYNSRAKTKLRKTDRLTGTDCRGVESGRENNRKKWIVTNCPALSTPTVAAAANYTRDDQNNELKLYQRACKYSRMCVCVCVCVPFFRVANTYFRNIFHPSGRPHKSKKIIWHISDNSLSPSLSLTLPVFATPDSSHPTSAAR